MFELKTLHSDAIPAAVAKAERYRFLNDASAAESICQLFEESKLWYFSYAAQPFRLGQAFGSLGREEERALMGPDPWPYNVSDNLPSLQILADYAYEQGLIAKRVEIESLFYGA